MSAIRQNPVPRFTYEVGKRYRLYGSWSNYEGCVPEVGTPLLGECVYVSIANGKARIARVDEDGRVHPHTRWVFSPNGYALLASNVKVSPLAVVLYEVQQEQRTITINGKVIEISEESFQALKKELCK